MFDDYINDLGDLREQIDRVSEALRRLELNMGPNVLGGWVAPGESWWTLNIAYKLQDGSSSVYRQDYNTLGDVLHDLEIFAAAGLMMIGKEV